MTTTPAPGDNIITRMFAWWDAAYRDHAFDTEGFARFFTDDAPFIVNGRTRGTGPAEICAHFQRIRAETDSAELALPAIATLADEELGFVRYSEKYIAGGKAGAEESMAVARFRDGLIASFEVFGRAA